MKYAISLFAYFSFMLLIQAQDDHWHETETIKITKNTSTHIKNIFEKIRRKNGSSNSSLSQDIKLEKKIKWSSEASNHGKYHAQVSIIAKQENGHLTYRQIPIQHQFIPHEITCKVWDYSSGSKKLIQALRNLECEENNHFTATFNFAYFSISQKLDLRIEDLTPHYNNMGTSKILEQLHQIDTYYRRATSIKRFHSVLERMDVDDVDKIEENSEKLSRIKRKIRESRHLINQLRLKDHDPAHLLTELEKINTVYEFHKKKHRQIQKDRHVIYYKKGIALITQGSENEAVHFLKLALKHQTNYTPAHIALARLELKHNNLDRVLDQVEKIKRSRDSNPETRQELKLLYRDIYQHYMDRAEKKQTNKDYEQALSDYTEAQKICRFFDGISQEREVERKIQTLKNDQFYTMISAIQSRLNDYAPRLNEIRRSLEEATRFRTNNAKYIQDTNALNRCYRTLTQKALNKTQNYLNQQDQSFQFRGQITECLNIAQTACSKSNDPNCLNQIQFMNRQVKITEAKTQIRQADEFMNQGSYLNAYHALWGVENYINANQRIIQDQTLTRFSWNRFLNHQKQEIESMLISNQFDQAMMVLEQMISDIKKLPAIPFDVAITTLSNKVYRQKYNADLKRIKRLIQEDNYQSAYQNLRSITRFQTEHEAHLTNLRSHEIKNYYRIIFQHVIKDIQDKVTRKNYRAALSDLYVAKYAVSYAPSEDLKFRKIAYTIYFGVGETQEAQKNYKEAIINYEKAKNIATKYAIPHQKKFVENATHKIRKNILLRIDRNILLAHQNIAVHKLEHATELVEKNNELREKYNVDFSEDIQQRTTQLRDRIRVEKCKISQSNFQKSVKEAKIKIQAHQFSDAVNMLKQSIEKAESLRFCSVPIQEAQNLMRHYHTVDGYEKLLDKANENLEDLNYKDFMEQYLQAEEQHRKYKISQFGVSHIDFKTFVLEKRETKLFHFLALHYAQKDLVFTKKLLNKLVFRHYNKYAMRKLGREIAEKDFFKNDQVNPKNMVEKYKFKKEGFRQFRKGYLQIWK